MEAVNVATQNFSSPLRGGRKPADESRADELRERRDLLDGLQEQAMKREAIEYVLAKFEDELIAALAGVGSELEQMRQRKEELEREIETSPSSWLKVIRRRQFARRWLIASARSVILRRDSSQLGPIQSKRRWARSADLLRPK